jgi:hypothetical protein
MRLPGMLTGRRARLPVLVPAPSQRDGRPQALTCRLPPSRGRVQRNGSRRPRLVRNRLASCVRAEAHPKFVPPGCLVPAVLFRRGRPRSYKRWGPPATTERRQRPTRPPIPGLATAVFGPLCRFKTWPAAPRGPLLAPRSRAWRATGRAAGPPTTRGTLRLQCNLAGQPPRARFPVFWASSPPPPCAALRVHCL